jgi:hypothetical protein
MDKVIMSEETAAVLTTIKELMEVHDITSNQALYLMFKLNNIEYDVTKDEHGGLFNKGLLLLDDEVNTDVAFAYKKNGGQLELKLEIETTPKGTEISLTIAEKIEKEFVVDENLTNEYRQEVASEFFKSDKIVARYFIIFEALFPTKNPKRNRKWNAKFGFIYNGVGLKDHSVRVAKKFHEVFRKKDMGVFLEATYNKVRDSINLEKEECYMMKPYKFLSSYSDYYRDAKETMKQRTAGEADKKVLNESLNNLKL